MPSGWNTYNHFILWSNTSPGSLTKGQMPYLEDTFSCASLGHVYLDLSISSPCNKMMKISRSCTSRAKLTQKGTSHLKRVTCLKVTDYVCLRVAPESSYLGRSMVMSTTFHHTCFKTFKTWSRGDLLVKWPRVMHSLKGSTPPCLHHKDHG